MPKNVNAEGNLKTEAHLSPSTPFHYKINKVAI